MASMSARSPTVHGSSSRNTTEPEVREASDHSAHGINCFLPMSATTIHHGCSRAADSHARITGFSPLLALA